MNQDDLRFRRFGHWTAVEMIDVRYDNGRKRRSWRCVCDCGTERIIPQDNLTRGKTKSCGCERGSSIAYKKTKHSECDSRLYSIWTGMKERCYNPGIESFANYGALGISVCEEWAKDYKCFRDWAYANGYEDSLTIDRIDVRGDYQPSNCRWVDRIAQANNKRTNIRIEWNGEIHTLAEWCRILNLPYKKTHARYRYYGWSVDDIFHTA